MVDVMGTTLHLPPIRSLVPSLAQEMSLYSSHPLITPPPLIPIPVSHHQLIEQPQPKQQFQPQEEDHLETFSFLSPPSFPQDHTDEVVFAMLDVPSPPPPPPSATILIPIASCVVEETNSSAPDDKGMVVPSSLVNASVGGSGRGGRRGRGGRASPLTVVPSSVAVPESANAAQTEVNSAPALKMPRQRRGREGRGNKAVQDAVIEGGVVKESKSQVDSIDVEEERVKKVEEKKEVTVVGSQVDSSPMEVVDIKAFERSYLQSSSPSIDPTPPERPVVVKEEVTEPRQEEYSKGEQPVAALSSASRSSRSRRPRRSTPSMGSKGIENLANATQDLSTIPSMPVPVAAAPSKTAAVSRGVAIEAAPSTQTVAVTVPSAAVTVPSAAETATLVQDGATSRPQQKPQQRRQQTKPAGTAKREVVNGTKPEQAPMPQERPHAQGPLKASGNDAPRRTDGEGRERGVGGRRRMSREKGAVPTAKPPVQQSNAQSGQ